MRTSDLTHFVDSKVGICHKEIADELRNKVSYNFKQGLNIEEINFFPKPSLHPIIFEEIFIKETKEILWVPNKPTVYDNSKYLLIHKFFVKILNDF